MGRSRNPRYTPESLERRSSPSALIGTVPVLVWAIASLDGTAPTEPPDGDGDPPDTLPTIPVGPSLPAS